MGDGPHGMELSERAQYLFKTLVERYIADGQPVGSRTLARDTGLELSPATIRNVMADLEDLGLIRAPHTSAGRVPTARGYRFFVDSILTYREPALSDVRRFANDLQHEGDVRRLLEKTYAKIVLHKEINGLPWTAIQITTAAGITAVLDLLKEGALPSKGFIRNEDVPFEAFIGNRFGKHYA